ncbi:hypothetical protein ABT150_23590 [Streptomyces mirabilis]|uniref:hypothetical protein n=1 Tax=Streptomyces mirabilis TaxID=68239 RepID=UPI003324C61C
MSTYKGRATLWLPDGRQLDANADLSKDTVGSWRGTLAFHDEEHIPVLVNVRDGVLHVGENYGDFVRPDTSDWAATPRGPFRMRIEGNGDAPF